MNEQERLAQLADACIERLLAGEPPGDILRAYPDDAEALRPLLESAVGVHVAVPAPSPAARTLAFDGMVRTLAQPAGAGATATAGGIGAIMSWFSRQPIAVKGLAVVAGVLMVSGVAAGASAAGTAPDPVREFFGFEANSSIRVQFTGVIRGIDAANGALTVEAGTDVRTVIVDSATELEDDDDRDMAFEDLAVGDIVEVRGSLQPDNTILADHVERDDDDDDFGTPVGTPFDPTPADPQVTPQPTFDDDDDDRDDDDGNSGPGNGDDASNDDDDDNSGPGSGDDDDGHDDDDDNSGPGSGDDGHGDDDNSGPGNGDDDDDDRDDDSDNSGPGNGDDDDDDRDDDNSGSGSGDDDDDDGGDDDDDDNSGSGGGDDDDDDD